MSEKVEQVAEAISEACNYALPPFLLEACAKAAIQAMREPTGSMIVAGVNKYENGDPNEYCSASGFQDGWKAAIDEALK